MTLQTLMPNYAWGKPTNTGAPIDSIAKADTDWRERLHRKIDSLHTDGKGAIIILTPAHVLIYEVVKAGKIDIG